MRWSRCSSENFLAAPFYSVVVRAVGGEFRLRGEGRECNRPSWFNPWSKLVKSRSLITRRAVSGVAALGGAMLGSVVAAFAQQAQGTIGAQVQTMAQEFSTAGGFAASTAMYVGALVCFVAGVWFLWQSRLPENRTSGQMAAGMTGLILTGLLVTGGAWINKAAADHHGHGGLDLEHGRGRDLPLKSAGRVLDHAPSAARPFRSRDRSNEREGSKLLSFLRGLPRGRAGAFSVPRRERRGLMRALSSGPSSRTRHDRRGSGADLASGIDPACSQCAGFRRAPAPGPGRRAAIGGGALRLGRRRRLVRRARGDPGLRIEKRRGRSAARHEFPWRAGRGLDAGEAPSLCRSRPPAWRLENSGRAGGSSSAARTSTPG